MIGINHAERGDITETIELFEKSFLLYPNPLSARNLAVMQQTSEDAWKYFQISFDLLNSEAFIHSTIYDRLSDNIVTEISYFLQQNEWYNEIELFIPKVSIKSQSIDAYLTMKIKYYIQKSLFSEAKIILESNCFPTYAKARIDLMNYWNVVVMGQAAIKKGNPLSLVEQHQVRLQNRIPDNIGCQYASNVSNFIN